MNKKDEIAASAEDVPEDEGTVLWGYNAEFKLTYSTPSEHMSKEDATDDLEETMEFIKEQVDGFRNEVSVELLNRDFTKEVKKPDIIKEEADDYKIEEKSVFMVNTGTLEKITRDTFGIESDLFRFAGLDYLAVYEISPNKHINANVDVDSIGDEVSDLEVEELLEELAYRGKIQPGTYVILE